MLGTKGGADLVGISRAIFEATTMDDFGIVSRVISEFGASSSRAWMLIGKEYYRAHNDILKRRMYRYVGGSKTPDEDKINNRVAHPFMRLVVDEKAGYLLGTAPVFTSTDEALQERLQDILDDTFLDTLIDVAVEASNCGIGWLHPFIATDAIAGGAKLCFADLPSEQIIPLWADEQHTKLDAVVRHYYVTEYHGQKKVPVLKVELWTDTTVQYYTAHEGELVLDIGRNPLGDPIGHFATADGRMYGWGMVPFIPFMNNSAELPDIYFVKCLIDEYDKAVSDQSNSLEELTELVYVLRNYGGTNLEEFMSDLKYYRAIKVDDDGNVETLSATLNPDAHEKHLDRLKSDFYQFSQSVDMSKETGLGNNPSGVALEFMYSGLKLKASAMERKFKAAFRILFWFTTEYLKVVNEGTFDPSTAKVTFTPTAIANTRERIETANASMATTSRKTALENHPWVDDTDEEMSRIAEEGEISLTKALTALRAGAGPTGV